MFWTDCGDNAVIERAFMDGTERSIIVSGSLVWPNGLTIDYDGKDIFKLPMTNANLSFC